MSVVYLTQVHVRVSTGFKKYTAAKGKLVDVAPYVLYAWIGHTYRVDFETQVTVFLEDNCNDEQSESEDDEYDDNSETLTPPRPLYT